MRKRSVEARRGRVREGERVCCGRAGEGKSARAKEREQEKYGTWYEDKCFVERMSGRV